MKHSTVNWEQWNAVVEGIVNLSCHCSCITSRIIYFYILAWSYKTMIIIICCYFHQTHGDFFDLLPCLNFFIFVILYVRTEIIFLPIVFCLLSRFFSVIDPLLYSDKLKSWIFNVTKQILKQTICVMGEISAEGEEMKADSGNEWPQLLTWEIRSLNLIFHQINFAKISWHCRISNHRWSKKDIIYMYIISTPI